MTHGNDPATRGSLDAPSFEDNFFPFACGRRTVFFQICSSMPMYKASSVKTRLAKVEKLQRPALNPDVIPAEHLLDKLEHRLNPRPPQHPNTSA